MWHTENCTENTVPVTGTVVATEKNCIAQQEFTTTAMRTKISLAHLILITSLLDNQTTWNNLLSGS